MKQKTRHTSFDETLTALRAHGFDVAWFPAVAGGVLVSKDCVGAVLAAAQPADAAWNGDVPAPPAIAFRERPGLLVSGEVSRLVDRGYQKFIKTSQGEFPASAGQLQAIHDFSEDLKQLTGAISLYNESLGTTSDLYEYDRLKGREVL